MKDIFNKDIEVGDIILVIKRNYVDFCLVLDVINDKKFILSTEYHLKNLDSGRAVHCASENCKNCIKITEDVLKLFTETQLDVYNKMISHKSEIMKLYIDYSIKRDNEAKELKNKKTRMRKNIRIGSITSSWEDVSNREFSDLSNVHHEIYLGIHDIRGKNYHAFAVRSYGAYTEKWSWRLRLHSKFPHRIEYYSNKFEEKDTLEYILKNIDRTARHSQIFENLKERLNNLC